MFTTEEIEEEWSDLTFTEPFLPSQGWQIKSAPARDGDPEIIRHAEKLRQRKHRARTRNFEPYPTECACGCGKPLKSHQHKWWSNACKMRARYRLRKEARA